MMMKKWISLLMCLCMLATCALADWDDVVPLGNERVGYLYPDTVWLPMRSYNLTDEQIAELTERTGFTQYVNLDMDMVILTMACLDDVDAYGEEEHEQLISVLERELGYAMTKMLQPDWHVYSIIGLLGEREVLALRVTDEAEDATEVPEVFFVFEDEGHIYHFEFEAVWDDETFQELQHLVSTWTPDLEEE